MSARPAQRSGAVRAALGAVLALFVAALTGCTTRIVPPAAPQDPVSVFVLDHGRHASLVLPTDARGAARYSYGDWDYYVLDRTDIATGLRALARPTQAALGRQILAGAHDAGAIARQLRVQVVESIEVRVAAGAVRRLRDELDALFAAAQDTLHYSAAYDVHFVHHPAPYTLAHNSNLMVARWLEALGCDIRGRPVLSSWRLAR